MSDAVSSLFNLKDTGSTDQLSQIEIFLEEKQILDLSGDLEEDVGLEPANADEVLIGPLNKFERRVFVVQALLAQAITDFTVENDAEHAEKIAAIVRKERVTTYEAQQRIAQTEDGIGTRQHLNMTGISANLLINMYEWSVRSRYNEWHKRIIVRSGYMVYAY